MRKEPALDFPEEHRDASHVPTSLPPTQQALPAQTGNFPCLEKVPEDSGMLPDGQAPGLSGSLPASPHPSPGLTGLPSEPQMCQVHPDPGPLSGLCVLLRCCPQLFD